MNKYFDFSGLYKLLTDNEHFNLKNTCNVLSENRKTVLYISSALVSCYLVKKLLIDKKARPTDNWKKEYDFVIGNFCM